MTRKKIFRQTITVLGSLALGLSVLPIAAKAETNYGGNGDTLSPAPSNNPTKDNTVNGTTIPVWTLNESEQITLPSRYLSVYSSDRDDLSTRDLSSRTGIGSDNRVRGNNLNAPTGEEPNQQANQTSERRQTTTPEPGSTGDRSIPPATSNTPGQPNTSNGTTIPEQTINQNEDITLPSDSPGSDRTNNNNTGTSTTSPSTGTNRSTDQPYVPSGLQRSQGNPAGGPPRGPAPTGGDKQMGSGSSGSGRSGSGSGTGTTTTPTGVDRRSPSQMTPGSGTTVPDQTINENQEINTPNRSTTNRNRRTTPGTTNSNTRPNVNQNNTGSGMSKPSGTSTDTQNMNITPNGGSGSGAPGGSNTGGPPQGPSGSGTSGGGTTGGSSGSGSSTSGGR